MSVALFPSAYGIALGSKVVDNSVALEGMEAARKTILLSRLGVKERFVALLEENVITLARQAMEQLPLGGGEGCDMLVAVTQTSPNKLPHIAGVVQHECFPGRQWPSFDLNLGCSGFVYAYILLNSLHAAGRIVAPVLICADTYNKHIRSQNNSAALLFSDAAVCMTFSASDSTEILAVDMGGDGAGAVSLCLRDPDGLEPSGLHMDGAAVMQFTMGVVPDSVLRVLSKANLSKEEIDFFCFHQASAIVLGEIARKLEIPAARIPSNLVRYGNTVSCSIPLLLKDLADEGKLRPGTKILMCGFGVGLSWASCIVKI